MTASARRRWWKKKRWRVVLALWVAVAYPASLGPANYALGRGWLDTGPASRTAEAFYLPLVLCGRAAQAAWGWFEGYCDWCRDLGEDHAA